MFLLFSKPILKMKRTSLILGSIAVMISGCLYAQPPAKYPNPDIS
jgi:hypothetical protein